MLLLTASAHATFQDPRRLLPCAVAVSQLKSIDTGMARQRDEGRLSGLGAGLPMLA